MSAHIYNIPSGQPFLKSLAAYLLRGEVCDLKNLSDVRILLPTRRACRSLQQAFLELNDGQAMIMPRLQPLGDVDEEELSLAFAGHDAQVSLPPAISSLRRQMLLARLIYARGDFEQGFDQALELASALAALMDQIYTENLDMADLAGIVPDEFSDHWRITLEFLEIISAAWPQVLAEEGVIDAADRRNRLLLSLAEVWRKSPPDVPVIVAGTTGSIPATSELLRSVAAMDKGMIVLPGLDQALDEESWAALEETHPQYGMRELLRKLGVSREDVGALSEEDKHGALPARRMLAREIMRPAATSRLWAGLCEGDRQDMLQQSYHDLSLYICEHEQEEAQVIAILLRRALEDQERTACLVTPDRNLAARVAAVCRRWGVDVDDSAGFSLLRSQIGGLLTLVLAVCKSRAAPRDVLALTAHPLMRLGVAREEYADRYSALNITLRGVRPAAGFEGLKVHIKKQDHLPENVRENALSFLQSLETAFSPLIHYEGTFSFASFLRAHLGVTEVLAAAPDQDGADALWSGADGQAASSFFAELLVQANDMQSVDVAEYAGALEVFMRGMTLRSVYGMHPRVQILGQIEARMIDADFVVLGGLNEGVWPADGGHDPWMSRPMRKSFGLPGLERSIGLAAHDFVQGLCAPDVVITRSMRQAGAPSVPSRWLQRLEAVVQAAGNTMDDVLIGRDALIWARGMDEADAYEPVRRPEPRPPVSARPRRLSVTKIEVWLRDPYSIYAGLVLGLQPLEEIEKPVDAALRGSFVHDVMERFVAHYPHDVPEGAAGVLQEIGRDVLAEYGENQEAWRLWWPRFERMCEWAVGQEAQWRTSGARPLLQEAKGELRVTDDFVLSGRVDRIDKFPDGSAAILDYKSGGSFAKTRMSGGELPQLPLEALMLRGGGFTGAPAVEASCLSYWVMTGGREAGKEVRVQDNVAQTVEHVEAALKNLIVRFGDKNTPYYSLPRPADIPRFNDYIHLARVAEWAALDDAESEAA